ncbi:MAG: permease [Deltaproteobacteria bacterium RBG_13_47_9]|nr:MAG: permease [Deltaproteobacteria bacterium RBG_13_47_9]
MNKKRRNLEMLIPTVIMGIIAIILIVLGYYKGGGQHITGVKTAMNMMISILPLLISALVVAGMIQTLLPRELLSKWIGVESGLRGIIIGTVVGGFSPGGPYINLPIAIGLLRSGASVGTMVAFLTGWSLWAFARLPMEVGILGWKLTLIRLASTFFFPPIAGLIAQLFFGGSKLIPKM